MKNFNHQPLFLHSRASFSYYRLINLLQNCEKHFKQDKPPVHDVNRWLFEPQVIFYEQKMTVSWQKQWWLRCVTMALRRQKRGTGSLSERRALLKICFFSVKFSASAHRRHGQLFFVCFILSLSHIGFPTSELFTDWLLCIDIFFLANLFHCPCNNVLLKAFIVFFSPGTGFTDNGFIFSVYKDIKKKQDKAKPARLSRFYFNVQAFIFNKTRYEVVLKKTIVFTTLSNCL